MSRSPPTQAQLDCARRWLAHDASTDTDATPSATAAGRVYDKLHAHLAPLVGVVGVDLLFTRSAKLVQGEFASPLERSATLRDRLQTIDPESAVKLFGTFFSLVTTFIGERLTTQILRRAWPTLDETTPPETHP